jgi:multiple sugar transport system permease protein
MAGIRFGKRSQQTANPPSGMMMKWMRPFLQKSSFTLFVFMILVGFLMPFGYMVVTSLKNRQMITKASAPIWPAMEASFNYEDQEYPIYEVPMPDGSIQDLALVDKMREESFFIDPASPEAGLIRWEGRWRTLDRVWTFYPRWDNFAEVWTDIRMPLLLRNTLAIALIGTVGTLISCIAVAYGFSRFRIPGKNAMFMILIGTIILPQFVTLVPTYALFQRIGWVGSWLPLIVPTFFANAYDVFLLRQFFMTIPRELDEAAMIDGASPFRTLISVILPQAVPAIIAVSLLHIVYAWNDYMGPLIYLSSNRDLQPIALGIQDYNALYSFEPQLIQASSLLGLILPVVLFFVAQRFFMQGVKFTGVEK